MPKQLFLCDDCFESDLHCGICKKNPENKELYAVYACKNCHNKNNCYKCNTSLEGKHKNELSCCTTCCAKHKVHTECKICAKPFVDTISKKGLICEQCNSLINHKCVSCHEPLQICHQIQLCRHCSNLDLCAICKKHIKQTGGLTAHQCPNCDSKTQLLCFICKNHV